MISWILLLVYILTSSVGMVLIKKGGIHTSFAISKEKVQVQISWVILFGIMLYLVSFVLHVAFELIRALSCLGD